MEISKETLDILVHLSKINPGIKIEPGNTLISKSEISTMCCVVEVPDIFTNKFCTSNLPKFLATVSLVDDPVFEINDECININSRNGKNRVIFYQSNESLVAQTNQIPKDQSANLSASFTLKSDVLSKILKSADVLGVNDIEIRIESNKVYIYVTNSSIKTSDAYYELIGETKTESPDCSFLFNKRNIKLITKFDYDVELYNVGLSKFTAINSSYNALDTYIVCTFAD